MPQVVTVGSPSHNEAGAVNGTSIAVTRNGIVAGSAISVAVTVADTGTITNVTDGTTTLTTADVNFHWVAGFQWIAIFTFLNHPGGNFTFTANFSPTSQFRTIDIVELAGVEAVDGTSSNSGSSATPSSGTITPTRDGGYQVGFALGATALTSGAGWTDLFNDPTVVVTDFEGRQRPDKSALAATWTMTSGIWGAVAVQYRPRSALGYQAGLQKGPQFGPRDTRGMLLPQRYETTQPASALVLTADVGSLIFTGFAPSIAATATSGLGQLVLTGFSPALLESVAAGLGQLAFTGFGPLMMESETAGVGQVSLTGFAPSMQSALSADVGLLLLTGFIPSIGLTSGIVLVAGTGDLLLAGFAPTIQLDGVEVAGTGPKRTGDQILDVLQSFEQGNIAHVAQAIQNQRDEDVYTALANVGADEEEMALILYWIHGGF